MGAHHAQAAAYIWTGTTDSAVETTTNWNPALGTIVNNDTFTFDGTGTIAGTLTLSSATVFNPNVADTTNGSGMGLFSLTSGQVAAVSINSTGTSATGFLMRMHNGAGISVASGAGALTFNANNPGGFVFNIGGSGASTSNFAVNVTNSNATGGNAITFGANTFFSGGGSGSTTVVSRTVNFNGTGDVIVNGRILNSSRILAVTKSNTGVLTLAGNNIDNTNVGGQTNIAALSGGVTLSGGTLNINHANAIGSSVSRLTIGADGVTINNTSGAAITMNNNVITLGGNFTFTGTNDLNFGTGQVTLAAGATRTIATTAGNLTVGGAITNGSAAATTGSLIKSGAGALAFAGANLYTGTTTVNAGTLSLTATGSLNGTSTTVASGAVFNLNDDADYTFAIGANTVINGASAPGIGGTGTANLNGDFVFNLAGASVALGNVWQIVDVSPLNEFFTDFFTVTGFTGGEGSNKIWTADAGGGMSYQFSETTGQLLVIPEPGTSALVLAGLGLLMGFQRARRISRRSI